MRSLLKDPQERRSHWDGRYLSIGPEKVSWFQRDPTVSLELIDQAGLALTDAVIDIGAGASFLVDRLLERGFSDVTVLDVSDVALSLVNERISARFAEHLERRQAGGAPEGFATICCDLLEWTPPRRYKLWHDRAVFHFMVDPQDRVRYRACLAKALDEGGIAVIATFAADGPEECSQLPVARYSPDSLFAELSQPTCPGTGGDGCRFELLQSRREVHITPSGGSQPFSWVMLRRCG